jgi:hypothetical protein
MASAHAWRKIDNYLLKGDRSPILPDRAFLWAVYLTQRRKGILSFRGLPRNLSFVIPRSAEESFFAVTRMIPRSEDYSE